MLRVSVLFLILCNGIYFTWSQGFLRAYGFAPSVQTEPYRMAQQIRPQAISLLTQEEFAQIEAQALQTQAPVTVVSSLGAKECLQAGPFSNEQLDVLSAALNKTLAPEAWQLHSVVEPERWMIYMGKYPNEKMLNKKRDEILAMQIRVESLSNPALEPGFSLGSFPSLAAANTELARLRQIGVRSARLIQEEHAPRQTLSMLKIPAPTEAIKSRLIALKPALVGKTFVSCN